MSSSPRSLRRATTILAAAALLASQAIAFPQTGDAGSAISSCGSCHPRPHEQWRRSLHARSTDDPIYRAMLDWAVRDVGRRMEGFCAGCHSVALAGSARRTPSVGCRACHQGTPGRNRGERLLVDPEIPVLSPRQAPDAPHPVEVTTRLASGTVCQPCHVQLKNPRGVTLCSTGLEARAVAGPGCPRCHMAEGGHAFEGASPRLLARAASLSLDPTNGILRVAVRNSGAGHGLPTGSPLRQIRLEVRFLDTSGRVLSTHEELFARVFADANGRTPVPPWRAASVARDTRIGRAERRAFSYPVPAAARRVEARLVYHRLPGTIATRLGLAGEPSVRPVTMVRAVRSLR